MQKLILLALGLVLGLVLGACHDSNGSDTTNFDPFVTNLIQDQTTETGTPVEVNGANFVFSDDETALDAVLPPDGGALVPQ
jgi:ABC-type glycerol-3-phosphate transport system substrate-binding protein